MMTFIFCISILLIAIAIIAIVASTIEYFFMSNIITRMIAIEYRQTLKLATATLIIGIIFMAIYINSEGIPQMIGW